MVALIAWEFGVGGEAVADAEPATAELAEPHQRRRKPP